MAGAAEGVRVKTSSDESTATDWKTSEGTHLLYRGRRKVALITENKEGGFELKFPADEDRGEQPNIYSSLSEAKAAAKELAEERQAESPDDKPDSD
jgi:hypothetical protein